MFLKIFGMGFIFNSNAYLKDYWNFMDIIIVISSWIPILIKTEGNLDFSTFRALRVLRPLKTVKNIKALRKILIAIILAIPVLKNTFIIQWFNYLIFAIAGLNLMKGTFK